MMTRWEGRVAVVTGAARGLGEALARGLSAKGVAVALVDRSDAVGAVAASLSGATHHVTDVADRTAVERLAAEVVARHGRVDLLVNNAGVAVAGDFEAVPHEDFEWLMGVNFWGAVHGCRAFLPHMRRHPEGHIVNVASSFAWLGFPGKSAYCASKAALRALSESLRAELAGSGIGVTLLFPGPLDTSLVRDGRAVDREKQAKEAEFVRARAVSLERVVRRTLRAVERDRARVLVGADYRLLDAAVRLSPTGALAAVTRSRSRMPF